MDNSFLEPLKPAETQIKALARCKITLVKWVFLKRSKMEFPKVVLMMSMKEERPNTRQEPSKAAKSTVFNKFQRAAAGALRTAHSAWCGHE